MPTTLGACRRSSGWRQLAVDEVLAGVELVDELLEELVDVEELEDELDEPVEELEDELDEPESPLLRESVR
jgi:hypothetical protein